jgi:hypothetical protein
MSGAGGITFNSNVTINGTLNATAKSFLIPHPSQSGKMLRYGSLEGPENGVYIRGRLIGENKIVLPSYWKDLVDINTLSVNLTPIGNYATHYVESMDQNSVTINSILGTIDCFYIVFAERKDIDKLVVEY